MKDELTDFMESLRAKRLVSARQLLKPRVDELIRAIHVLRGSFTGMCPDDCDIALFPEIRGIIESPPDTVVTIESFRAQGFRRCNALYDVDKSACIRA